MSVFEKEISRRGGRLKLDMIHPDLVPTYQYFLDRANEILKHVISEFDSIREISFVIINNYEFKAFAMGEKGKYLIGINRGLISTLLLVFDRIFADKDLFTEIGNPDLEISNLPIIENFSSNYIHSVKGLNPFNSPACEIRNQESKNFTKKAFDIVLQHEVHHILRGHIDFLNAFLRREIDELNFNWTGLFLKNMINKTLEVDADESSAESFYRTIIKYMGAKNNKENVKHVSINNLPESIRKYTATITLLFKIFGDNRLSEQDFQHESYPAPRLRNYLITTKIFGTKEYVSLKDQLNIEEFSLVNFQEFLKGIIDIEKCLEKITGKQINMDAIQDVLGDLGANQIEQIYTFWNDSLLDKLQQYSYVPLTRKIFIGAN